VVAPHNPWRDWNESSRFIVDFYHYNNYKATDILCQTWCNPAPLNDSVPNLVETQIDDNGEAYQESN